jgi:hypothetical protein
MTEICSDDMRAIEIANSNNWNNFWLETNSALVVMFFKTFALMPRKLSNRRLNCIRFTRNMNFVVY